MSCKNIYTIILSIITIILIVILIIYLFFRKNNDISTQTDIKTINFGGNPVPFNKSISGENLIILAAHPSDNPKTQKEFPNTVYLVSKPFPMNPQDYDSGLITGYGITNKEEYEINSNLKNIHLAKWFLTSCDNKSSVDPVKHNNYFNLRNNWFNVNIPLLTVIKSQQPPGGNLGQVNHITAEGIMRCASDGTDVTCDIIKCDDTKLSNSCSKNKGECDFQIQKVDTTTTTISNGDKVKIYNKNNGCYLSLPKSSEDHDRMHCNIEPDFGIETIWTIYNSDYDEPINAQSITCKNDSDCPQPPEILTTTTCNNGICQCNDSKSNTVYQEDINIVSQTDSRKVKQKQCGYNIPYHGSDISCSDDSDCPIKSLSQNGTSSYCSSKDNKCHCNDKNGSNLYVTNSTLDDKNFYRYECGNSSSGSCSINKDCSQESIIESSCKSNFIPQYSVYYENITPDSCPQGLGCKCDGICDCVYNSNLPIASSNSCITTKDCPTGAYCSTTKYECICNDSGSSVNNKYNNGKCSGTSCKNLSTCTAPNASCSADQIPGMINKYILCKDCDADGRECSPLCNGKDCYCLCNQ